MPDTIRNTAKAIIRRSGRILAIRCGEVGGAYYTLPGGQQQPGEPLAETLIRECREEIGCDVIVGDLYLLTERPHTGLGHMVDHYFLCELGPGAVPSIGSHPDYRQTSTEWLLATDIGSCPLHPLSLRGVVAGKQDRKLVYGGLCE